MSIDVTSGNDLELWHVQIGGGVRTMTLDELDQAFQSGVIHERTMVLRSGALHWTTLGDVAGIDEHPNSIAPVATDVSSNVIIPPLPAPSFDVSFGTEELRVFRPKRRIGRAVFAALAMSLVAGAVFGVKSYGPDRLQAKLTAVTSLVKPKDGESARTAAIVPAAVAEPQTASASLPPPTPVDSLPSATPAAASVSVDSLPSAPPEKADKKRKKSTEPSKRRAAPAKAKSKPSTDPSGRFDPLNGNL